MKNRKLRTKKGTVKTRLPKAHNGKTGKKLTISKKTHLRIERPKVIAPSASEKNYALKTLMMIYQSNEFSGDETRVFQGFLDHFKTNNMEKGDLYRFLSDNPTIRRKIWETQAFDHAPIEE